MATNLNVELEIVVFVNNTFLHAWLYWENSSMVGNWRKGPLLALFQPCVMSVPAGFLWLQK